jgi:hypothetical protein
VSELRGEVTEVAASHNTSAELQRREELNSELGLLRGDVASVRKDLEELQAAQQKDAIALAQSQQDILAVKAQAQNAAALCADTRNQVIVANAKDYAHFLKQKRLMTRVYVYGGPKKSLHTVPPPFPSTFLPFDKVGLAFM